MSGVMPDALMACPDGVCRDGVCRRCVPGRRALMARSEVARRPAACVHVRLLDGTTIGHGRCVRRVERCHRLARDAAAERARERVDLICR